MITAILLGLVPEPSPILPVDDGDSIVVTGVRDDAAPDPGGFDRIETETLESLQNPRVDDALARLPGIAVSRNGAPGGFSAVRIRGADAAQTLVVIDGVRANDAAAPGGGFDFASLGSAGVDSIEVLRGPASVAWGSDAIGGVVAVQRGMIEGGAARVEVGSLDTARGELRLGGEVGPLTLAMGAGHTRTSGFSSAAAGVEADGMTLDQAHGGGALRLSPALSLHANVAVSALRSDLDGYLPDFSFGDTDERQELRETQASVRVVHRSAIRQELSFSSARTRRATFDDAQSRASFRSSGLSTRLAWRGDGRLTRGLNFFLGVDHDRHRAVTASAFGRDEGVVTSDAISGQLIAQPLRDTRVHVGLRQEWHDRYGANRVVAAAVEQAVGPIVLGARYGEGFKAPTLFQLSADPFAYGNPDLRPERSREWELSARSAREAALQWSVALFDRRTRDLIDFVACGGASSPAICSSGTRLYGTYDNVARASARGIELGARLPLARRWTLEMNATHLRSRDASAGQFGGKDLPRRPSTTALAALDYRDASFSAGAELRYVSQSFDDRANQVTLGSHVLGALRLAVPLSRAVALEGRVENLFDARYQTVAGYNSAPRTAAVALRTRW